MKRHQHRWVAALRPRVASALAGLTPRLPSMAMLPVLLCVTGLCRLARWLIDGV